MSQGIAADLPGLLDSFVLHLRAERKSSETVRTYRAGVSAFLAWCAACGVPAALDAPTVDKFTTELLDAGAEPATARSRQLAVRRFSAWLAAEGEIDTDQLARVQRQMLQDLGREPTPEELAAELDMTPEKVIEVQKYGREPISLHTPLGEDGDSEFGDLIEDSEAIQPGEAVSFTLLQEQLHSVLDTLSEREAGVVSMRFGLTDGQPKTLDEIGKVYGVTRERIRQIESKTMSKLRHPSRSQVLRDYLD